MSKRPKSKEFVSDSDEEGSVVKKEEKKEIKKLKKEEKAENATSWELGKKRRIQINEFKGKKLIDIREYYAADDGTEKPGRKGISLSIEQWEKLKEVASEVDQALS